MSILYRIVLWISLLFPWIDYTLKEKIYIYPLSSIWDDTFIVFVWILVLIRLKDILKKRDIVIPFLIFTSVIFISAGINGVSFWIMQDAIRRLILPFGIFLILSVSDIKPKDVILPLLVTTTPLAILGIYQYIAKVPIPPEWVDSLVDKTVSTRAFAIFINPNLFAVFLERSEAILLGLTIGSKGKGKYIWLSLLIIHFMAHIFTFSRSSLLSILLASTIGLLFINPIFDSIWIGIASATSLLIPSLRTRFLGLLSPYYRYKSSLGGRLFQWKVELNHWKKYPIWGSGPGTFGSITAWNLGLGGKFRIDMLYLYILGELGIVGLITFLWWLISILTHLLAKLSILSKHSINFYITWGGVVGYLSFLIQAFADNHFEVIPHMVFTWAILGVLSVEAKRESWHL